MDFAAFSSGVLATAAFAVASLIFFSHWKLGLLFLGFGLLLTFIAIYCYRRSYTHIPESSENFFSDFRVTKDSGLTLEFQVWYFYNGALGEESIDIRVDPLDRNGKRLPGGAALSGTQINIIGHKALADISYQYRPVSPERVDTSTHIQLCMEHMYKGVFHCHAFSYKKAWVQSNAGI